MYNFKNVHTDVPEKKEKTEKMFLKNTEKMFLKMFLCSLVEPMSLADRAAVTI